MSFWSFFLLAFLQSSTLMHITWKVRLLGNTFVPILELGSKEVLPFESVQCSKRIANGPMNTALSKQKKSFEHTHELINMNHTMSKSDNFVTFVLKTVFLQIWQLWPHFSPKTTFVWFGALFFGSPKWPNNFAPKKHLCVTMVKTKNQKYFWVASKHYRYPITRLNRSLRVQI
jgi:hypothetical protein